MKRIGTSKAQHSPNYPPTNHNTQKYLRWGYRVLGMSSSSVHRTPCCAGKRPVNKVAREGEHMAALQVASVKVRPFAARRLSPGMFSSIHPGGKSWIIRIWSMIRTITFLPLKSLTLSLAEEEERAFLFQAACPWPQRRLAIPRATSHEDERHAAICLYRVGCGWCGWVWVWGGCRVGGGVGWGGDWMSIRRFWGGGGGGCIARAAAAGHVERRGAGAIHRCLDRRGVIGGVVFVGGGGGGGSTCKPRSLPDLDLKKRCAPHGGHRTPSTLPAQKANWVRAHTHPTPDRTMPAIRQAGAARCGGVDGASCRVWRKIGLVSPPNGRSGGCSFFSNKTYREGRIRL